MANVSEETKKWARKLEPFPLPKPCYRVGQMAVLLHTSRANIYKLIKQKALKAFWYDNEWRVPVEALDEYLSHSYLTPDIHIELEKVLNRAFAVLEKVISMHPLASTYFAAFEKIINKLEQTNNVLERLTARISERQN